MPRETRQTNKKKSGSDPVVKLPTRKKRGATLCGETLLEEDVASKPLVGGSQRDQVGEIVPTTKVVEKREDVAKNRSVVPETNSNGDDGVYFKGISEVAPQNVLKGLDLFQYAPTRNRRLYIKSMQDYFVNKSIKQLTGADYAGRFTRRITALAWHEKYPYTLASASKFGDIMLISCGKSTVSSNESTVTFETKAELQGGGAGYSVTAMKFHREDKNVIYRCSIDCTVARVDLVCGETSQYYDTGDYNRWFCGMDVNFSNNIIIAGDNKGTAYKFSLDGKLLSKWRLHKNKIHHIEFSKKNPNLLVTSSLEKNEAVRIWDIRYLKDSEKDSSVTPLKSLPHACGLNCAKFNPSDGTRLLTSDQNNEIRVYQGPLWEDYLTIKHHHKQFQHITPIKADWHPVNDYIVIGRYPPKAAESGKSLARAIEFFNSYSGELVDMIYPPLDEICSLNAFNPTGEYLATGMNSKLILWKPGLPMDVAENSKTKGERISKISGAMRNVLRGRRREYSPTSDDEDENAGGNKKKRSKTNNPPSKTTTVANKAATSSRKKK